MMKHACASAGRLRVRALLTALTLAIVVSPSTAAQPDPLVIPHDDLNAFVEGMLDIQLKRDDASGAVLLLTLNGIPLLSRGFGVADVRNVTPMTDHTVLRVGGLTSVIIAVAVLQQVDAHAISLDQDIAPLLDIPLPPHSGPALTLRHLLTHTGGFAGSTLTAPAPDLRSFLTTTPPSRIFPAGAVHSFSPYGLALAAYVVERLTHESFPRYAQHAIFEPLEMQHSTLLQPLPATLAAAASQAYGASTELPLPPENLAPSLSLSTSAVDIGRFAQMLLNRGTLDNHTILSPQAVDTLLTRQVGEDTSPSMPSMALAFHQVWFNGSRYFGVSGDTAGFHSELEIDPTRNLVLFLAYNSSGHPSPKDEPSRLATFSRGEIIHGIFDRYQPFHPKVATASPTPQQERLAEGTWTPANEFSPSGPGLPSHPLHSHIDATTHALLVDRFISDRGTVKRWFMIEPNLWQQFPQDRIQAVAGRGGLPDRLILAADPTTELIRIAP